MGREGRNPGSGEGSEGGPVAVEVEVLFFHSSISVLDGAALPPWSKKERKERKGRKRLMSDT